MKKISEITRRDILDIIRDGFTVKQSYIVGISSINGAAVQETNAHVKMSYWGRLNEIEFLERLYPLKSMPSNDRRFSDAYRDIVQHTLNIFFYNISVVRECFLLQGAFSKAWH